MNQSKIVFTNLLKPALVNEIREFCVTVETIKTFEDLMSINSYLQQISKTLQNFKQDNEIFSVIDSVDDTNSGVGGKGKVKDASIFEKHGIKESDYQLYTQLVTMYSDYLTRLSNLKKIEKFVNTDLIKYDYMNPEVFPQELLQCKKSQVNKQYLLEILNITQNPEVAKRFSSIDEDPIETSATEPVKNELVEVPVSQKRKRRLSDTEQNKNGETIEPSSSTATNTTTTSTANKKQKTKEPVIKEDIQLGKSAPSSSSSSSLSNLKSILKNTTLENSDQNTNKSRPKKRISFNMDSITLFGADLPKQGKTVPLKDLKIALDKEKKSTPPREKILIDPSLKVQVLPLKPFVNIQNIPQCDISELKGGIVKLITQSSPGYRSNFKNFNKNLNRDHIEKEFHSLTESFANNTDSSSEPIIIPAFGQNELLLLKDRGRLPYKPVPEVRTNKYPPVSR